MNVLNAFQKVVPVFETQYGNVSVELVLSVVTRVENIATCNQETQLVLCRPVSRVLHKHKETE